MPLSERIKIEIDDAELDEVLEKLNIALAKKSQILSRERGTSTRQGEPLEAEIKQTEIEAERVVVEVTSKMQTLESFSDKVQTETDELVAESWAKIQTLEEFNKYTQAEMDAMEAASLAKLQALEQEAIMIQNTVDMIVEETKLSLIETAVLERTVIERFTAMNLPAIDRATRMILLRIPGLREAMRMMYIIKMEQRTLSMGGMIGGVTAILTSLIYISMAVQWFQRRQDSYEARLRQLEKDMDVRMITLEEAVRGYGVLPERYRSGISGV